MAGKRDIETAIALAEAETGVRGGSSGIPLCFAPAAKTRSRIWTEKEETFLRENIGRLSEAEIAKQLGRTDLAVRLHTKRDMHLPAMSKAPDILTAEQIAIGLGCDSKTIHRLIDTGLMPGRRLPSIRPIRAVDRLALMKWLLVPENWIYFKPKRVGALCPRGERGLGASYDFVFWEGARTLMKKALKDWKDSWLTPGQVVRRLKINPKKYPGSRARKDDDKIPGVRYVNVAIRKGNLKAVRWGNWWIKKSDLPKGGITINYKGNFVKKEHR